MSEDKVVNGAAVDSQQQVILYMLWMKRSRFAQKLRLPALSIIAQEVGSFICSSAVGITLLD